MNVRKNQILFRVTDKEFEQININVKKCGLSREAYLRKVSLGITPKELPTMDFLNIIYQLRMIGNNIHQIAVKANTLNFIDAPLYRKNYEELQEVIGSIMGAIY